MHDVLFVRNSIHDLFFGFSLTQRRFEENISNLVFENRGIELVDGHDCEKIVMIAPYSRGQKAYNHLWIEIKDEKYYILKQICIIEDDPSQILFQIKYTYDYSDAYPFPRDIYYERFEIDSDGNRKPLYELNAVIEKFEVNVPVEDREFVYFFPEGTIVNTTSASINPKTLVDPNHAGKVLPIQSAAEANQPVIDNRTEFPMGGSNGVILIPVYIHGEKYSFMVDAGASNTILDASLRDLLGKPKNMQRVQTAGNPMVMQMFESPLIQIGPFNIPKGSDVSCVDLSMFSMVDGRQINGILGMDFIKNHVIRIDFDRSVFSFLAHDDFNTSSDNQFDFTYNSFGLPQIKGQLLDGIEAEFVIDSGNNYFGSLDKDTFEKLATHKDAKISETLVVAASGPQKQREIRVKSLTIGNFDYKDTIFGESNYNCLGIDFLNRHVATLDFPKMKMYLSKSKRFEKIDEDDMSGLHLLMISGKVVVHSIDKNSPADKNDIISGDVIVKIDNKNTTDIEISQVRAILKSDNKKEVTLTIERNGQLKEITLILERKI